MRNTVRILTSFLLGLAAVCAGWLLLPGLMQAANPAQSMPDVAVLVYKESGIFSPGQEVKYQIYFINQGGPAASDVRIVDVLPPHTTYVTSSQPGFVLIQAGPDQVVWVRDRLSVFERGWLSLTVRVSENAPAGTWLDNTVYIVCQDPEADYDNNEYALPDLVLPVEPDLAVRNGLHAQSGPPGPGQQITYEIHARNQGGSPAHNVRITGTLPAGTTYLTTTSTCGYTATQTAGTVTWTRDTVPADSSCENPAILLDVQLPAGFDPAADWLENVVEISTTDTEANLDNNRNRYVWKSEPGPYGAAVTSVSDRTMQLLNEGGFDWMVYYLDWSKTEPQKGQYWWRDFDDAAWKAWWYHKKLAVRVDRAPDWARTPGSPSAPPANPDDLGDFLQAAASGRRLYQGKNGPVRQIPRADAFIVWNEPNLAAEWGGNAPDAAGYTALLQAAYTGVKAGNPGALVISAGLAPNNGGAPDAVDDGVFLQQMLDNGACASFDLLGAHPLGFASAPDDLSDPNGYNFARALEWRRVLEDNGCGKDMFAAEMGWLRESGQDLGAYNWMKVSLVDQAHYLARAYHKARREWPWMGPMATWNMDFASFYPGTDQMHWFGITGSGGDALRPYLTLQNAANLGPADLWVEKDLSGAAEPGEELVYVIHCTNIGGQPAGSVTLTDTLPDHTTFVSDSRGDGVAVDGRVRWDMGTMDSGARETITLTLSLTNTLSPRVYLENTVEAGPQPDEPYLDDNVATVITRTGAPLPPVLIHPPDGAVITDSTPALAWQPGDGDAAGYRLDFGGSILDAGDTLLYTTTLLADGTYTWTVAAYDVLDITGPFTDTWSFTVDTTGPEVTRTVPAHGEINVAVTKPLVIAFNEPVDPSTFSHILDPDPGGWVPTWAADGTVVTLTHNTLAAETAYSATVVSASDPYGNPMPSPYTWQFATAPPPPLPPVLAHPQNGAVITDSTPALAWQPGDGDAAGYRLDFAGSTLDAGDTLLYTTTLLADGTYTWTVAAYDALGQTGSFTDTWSFTVDTTGPEVTRTVPAHGETNVAVTKPLVIVFTETVDPSTFSHILDPDPGGWVPTWAADGTVVTLTHNTLALEMAYSATIASASDPYGNPMPSPYTWQFTTGAQITYLPLLEKNIVLAPDLVVDSLTATSGSVTVTIRNRGTRTVTEDFWVDVSFDPRFKPPQINQPWPAIAGQGIAWGITRPVGPGESLELVTGGQYYFGPPDSSPPPYPAGLDVYAYVDSVNWSTSWGAVWESDEGNNTLGAVVSIHGGTAAVLLPAPAADSENLLPRR